MNEHALLVFGGGGQLGRALSETKPPSGWRIVPLNRGEADITEVKSVTHAIAALRPAAVVNAAAYTAVDKAEAETEAAFGINRDGAAIVARASAAAHVPLIHISTDYVFDGHGTRPWREDDATAPLGVYGASKAAGEEQVRGAAAHHVILRTSWVFGVEGANFVKTMLRLGAERPELRVVDDQTGRPTYAGDLARMITTIAARLADEPPSDAFGTFHAAGGGAVTWFEFAQAIFADAKRRGGPSPTVSPIPTTAYPTPAKRPANSVLDCAKLEAVFGIRPRPWRDGLNECLDRLIGSANPAQP